MVTTMSKSTGKILVIEDEDSLQALLRFQLEREGYAVETAADGEAGLNAVHTFAPDLILLDLMMPVLDGRELCRRVRANPETSHIPIIMLTARAGADDKVEGLQNGANDYVTKPYEQRELLMRVRNLLEWGRLQRDANPLTGLPGNVAIEAEATRRLADRGAFVLMHIDLNDFKAFNDFYGYQKGDQALRLVAHCLRRAVESEGMPGDFVGHIGGDDFVLILDAPRASAVADDFLRRLEDEMPSLYSKADRARGYIQVVNRQGELSRYPLMSATVAAVLSEARRFRHLAEMCDVVAELKRFGKQQKGNIIVWDRRAA